MRKPVLKVGSLFGLLITLFLLVSVASAHPLDEIVHASYLTLTGDTLLLDLDVAPGVLVTTQVIPLIDTDSSGDISAAEEQTYADTLVSNLSLTANDAAIPLTLNSFEYSPYAELSTGSGVIRLHLSASLPGTASGEYALFFENAYEDPGIRNVYLANGFIQAGERTRFDITDQQRDYYQRTLLLSYTLTASDAQAQAQSVLTTTSTPVLIWQSVEAFHDSGVTPLIRALVIEAVRASQLSVS